MVISMVEDYFKCIFVQEQFGSDDFVLMGSIGVVLEVVLGMVIVMMKMFVDLEFVEYELYSGV